MSMENPRPGAPLMHLRLARQWFTATYSVPVVSNAPVSPTAPGSPPVVASATDIPALSVDALDAIDSFDDLDDLDVFDAVPSVTDSIAASAAADFPVVVLDDPDSPTFAAATLPTAPAAASPPTATLTTMAFLAFVALRATLAVAADSPIVALDDPVSHTAATDIALTNTDSPAIPLVANSTAVEDILALSVGAFNAVLSSADSTADDDVLALFHDTTSDNGEDMAPPAKRQRTGVLYDSNDKLVTPMLGCMPIGHLSRTALASMFQTLTGSGLGSLRVVSSSGTNLMSTLDPCEMVRNWLHSLCQYIMEGGSVKRILGEAATCHKAYIANCFSKGNTKRNSRTHMDPTGEVAKEMLEDDQHNSRILLGICQSDFVILLKYLPDLMEGEDEDLLVHLRNVSDNLRQQP
ncbi:hypothetical protein GGI17_005521 [Coemansia sp. S146]|nr:hypothetical protein GGI17_005521 [Coemansia sp. S146]